MSSPAVFLDRDGTINEEMGYINHLSRFKLLPGVAGAIRELNRAGLPVVVVIDHPSQDRSGSDLDIRVDIHHTRQSTRRRRQKRHASLT